VVSAPGAHAAPDSPYAENWARLDLLKIEDRESYAFANSLKSKGIRSAMLSRAAVDEFTPSCTPEAAALAGLLISLHAPGMAIYLPFLE
jgi:hypothetical protein